MTDREKLIALITDGDCDGRTCGGCVFADSVNGSCPHQTLADWLLANGVVAREKGEWMEHYNEGYEMWFYDCPFCDDGYSVKQRDKSKPNFCHNCGADMRKGENG